MLNYLFINSLILISFIFLGASISKELTKELNVYNKIILGLSGGLLGTLMIIYNFKVPGTNTVLDLRLLSLIMIDYVGGFIPTFISGSVIAIFRVSYSGINLSSITGVIQICASLLLLGIMGKKNRTSFKIWIIKLFGIVVILILANLYLLNSVADKYLIILNISLAVICVGTIEYFLLQYVRIYDELYKKYKEDSKKDYLTGLYNLRSFEQLVTDSFERARKYSERLSCLMIDIDYFKRVNDTYGHASGDMVLRELSGIIIRECSEFGIAGRIGGEEFCVLLLNCAANLPLKIGLRLRNTVREHKFPVGDGKYINITVSIGISTYPDTVSDLKSIIQKADEALYKAKQTGRDKVYDDIN